MESTVFGGAKESPSLRLAIDLVGEVLPKEFKLDPKRRYLTGVSMGGHAVWRLMVQRPGFFAAAVPVCSGGDANSVTKAAAKFPVWAFHSDDDHLVPVQQARDLVKAWLAHGGTAKYTEYTGLKHSSWKKAYVETEMYQWLFAQRLP
jgi:predicted peptidase